MQKLSVRFGVLLALCLTSLFAYSKNIKKAPAKPSRAEAPFHKGSNTIGLGLGAGLSYDYTVNAVEPPALILTFDRGIVDQVGPGNIGIGGILAIKSATYKYSGGYKATWRSFIIGARGTWHLTLLNDKNNKFDPYGGVTVGFRINSYTNTFYNAYPGLIDPYNSATVFPVVGAFVGAKYNFAKNFGAFAEVGYDVSFVRGGLCFNF